MKRYGYEWRVDTLDQLVKLRYERRSVFCPWSGNWAKPKPAAFMLNLSGEILQRLMSQGMIVYDSKVHRWDNPNYQPPTGGLKQLKRKQQ